MPITRSTRSPGWISVPTPLFWSTCTAIARKPGFSAFTIWSPWAVLPDAKSAVVIVSPALICWRAMRPTTWLGSLKASTGALVTGTSLTTTWLAVIVVPSEMSVAACTIFVVVATVALAPPGVVPPWLPYQRMPPNAATASRAPTRMMSRLDRFN